MSRLTKSALAGVAWTWTGSAVLVVAQIASTAATARLVAPHEFGLYAAAQAASGFAGFFCMRAVAQELQRRPRLGPRTVGTAISISLAASALVAACVALGAQLWADAWGVPEAASAIRVFGLALFLQSAAGVPLALLRRDLRFRRAAAIETAAIVAGMAAGVALAIQLRSALALALGQAGGATALFVAAYAAEGRSMRPLFDWADGRRMAAFAGKVGLLGFTSYFTITLPSWFVGRVFGAAVLGLYSRAQLMAELPADYAGTGIYRVIYPMYGRVRDDIARTRTLLSEALTLTTGLVWPAFALLAGASPLVVRIVLGPSWDEAATLLTLFSLSVCAAVPTGLLTNCAEALGWMRIIALRQSVLLVGTVVGLVSVYLAGLDVHILLIGVASAQWVSYLFTLVPFIRRGVLSPRATLADQGIHAGIAVVSLGVGLACSGLASSAPVGVQILTLGLGALAVCTALVVGRRMFPAGRVLVRRLGLIASRPYQPATAISDLVKPSTRSR